MMLLALLAAPADPDAAVGRLAETLGVPQVEARMRLARETPTLLARLADEPAAAAVARLRGAGLSVWAVEETLPRDASPLAARTFRAEGGTLTFRARSGDALTLAAADVQLIVRAASAQRSSSEQTERSRRLDLGTALLTSGLKLTKTVESSSRQQSVEVEQRLYVFDKLGRGALFRESEVDFSCLGPKMQAVRRANMAALTQAFRDLAPAATFDERLVRVGPRPLPFVFSGETRLSGSGTTQVRTQTAGGVELLVEALRRAALAKAAV